MRVTIVAAEFVSLDGAVESPGDWTPRYLNRMVGATSSGASQGSRFDARSSGRSKQAMQCAVEHEHLPSKTVLGVQPPVRGSGAKSSLAVLFDGLPMIEAGVPQALSAAQLCGDLPPITAVYVESIEGAAKRGPSRRSTLTSPDILRRFSDEAATFIAGRTNAYVDPSRRIAVGHSLGVIASLYLAAERPRFCRHVLALSAALWWSGESGQLSGQAAIDRALRRVAMRVWMTTGAADEKTLLDSNDRFYDRLINAGRSVVRTQHGGGHELRPADVVDGLAHLLDHR